MAKRHRNKHNTKSFHKPNSNLKSNFFWLVIWVLVYAGLYLIFAFLLKEIFGNFKFFQVRLLYILLIGLCFSISSRIIWSLIHKRNIYIGTDVFLFWTFAYGFSIWFGQFLRDLIIERFNHPILTNIFIDAIIIGIVVCLLIKLIKKIEFGFGKRRIRAPSQIATGIILIVAGILTFRFSYQIFVGWFNWMEGMAWSWLIGLGLIIAGFLVLIAWWRNNVLQHRVGIKFGRW
ncbi:hypothetical protein HYT26_02605 [Candidatus Pacearchaeota archaeon]|nr:hypothetical protein [Candidatus Pacearchaeota archaeon]